MKLTAFILLTTALTAAATGHSQTVTLDLKKAPVQKVFTEVMRQTGVSIVYSEQLFSNVPPISIKVKDAPLAEVMDRVLQNTGLSYSYEGKALVIKPGVAANPNGEGATLGVVEGPPPIDVKGRIVNENGEPVLASVQVKGTNKGTTTNNDGYFELKGVDDNATLVITASNIETREIKLNPVTLSLSKGELSVVNVKMKNSPLDEMQVIAYGTRSVREQIGNIATVKASEIEKQSIDNPLLALEGRIPGLAISQVSGISGGAINILIQGKTSIGTTSNDPFYVIDGVPYISQLPYGIGVASLGQPSKGNAEGNPLFYINPSDIESIEVLKDADATAIYGSRAANGAILITTKRGKSGKPKFNINLQQGWGKVAHFMNMMNTDQYVQMRREAFANDNLTPNLSNGKDLLAWDTSQYTNWQKELIGGTAHYNNVYTSVSGGTETVQYLVGATYRRQTTVYGNEFADKSGAVHFNLSGSSVNKKFRLQLSANYMVDVNKLPSLDLTQAAVLLAPNAPSIYNTDGTLNWGLTPSGVYTYYNPIANLLSTYTNKTNNLVSGAVLSYSILPGLDIKSNFGYTNLQTNDFAITPLSAQRPDTRGTFYTGQSEFGTTIINSWIAEPQVTYKKRFKQSDIEVLVGSSFQQKNGSVQSVYASGYTSDLLLQSIQAAPTISGTKNYNFYKYNAFFGRINYNWQRKYIVNAALRRDGSSRFGQRNRFHNFESIGSAWIFTEEKGIRKTVPFLSFGKIKASYGTTGNDQFADYAYISSYNSTSAGVPYQGQTGLYVNGIANPYIQWEETRKLMTGISLGFLDDHIVLDATYSRNRTSNQLLSYKLPSTTGFTEIQYYNFPATVQNTSWEFFVKASIINKKSASWSANFNLTIPQNKVTSFPNIEITPYATGLSGVIIGEPLGIQKVFHYTGVDPTTGLYSVADLNGNATTTPDFSKGYTDLIYPHRKFYGGLQNTITYKSFQIDFLFEFVNQIDKDFFSYYNGNNTPGQFNSFGFSNQPSAAFNNHWGKPGDDVTIQKYSTNQLGPLVIGTDAGYSTKPSFIRLKNASLSWNLSTSILRAMHVQRAQIYAQGQNLLTFTKFKGLDPEIGTSIVLPPLRVVTIGIQLNF